MKSSKVLLAAAVASALGVGASNASAHVYAHSFFEVDDLLVGILESDGMGGFVPAPNTITGFSLSLQNTATLNGAATIEIDGCGGTPAGNTCGPVGDRVDADIASLGAAAPVENTFVPQGPGGSEYAWADSLVPTSQLSLDPSGSILAGSEVELQGGLDAGSSAELTSTAGFLMSFTISGDAGNLVTISFDAALDNYTEIFPAAIEPASALADSDVQFTLIQQSGGGGFVSWSPNGTTSNCIAAGGITCTILASDFDLNDQRSINTTTSSSFSSAGSFAAVLSGLSNGDYSLGLASTTRSAVTQSIPEPGTLLLFGLGLAGLARRLGAKA